MAATSTVRSPPAITKHRQFAWSIDGNLFLVALVAMMCLGWTIWLILLTLAPNDTINWLMNTQTFDEGSFWRFIEPSMSTLFLGLFGLSSVALAYLYIIVRVTVFRQREFSGWERLSFRHQRYQPRPSKMAKFAVTTVRARNDTEPNQISKPAPPDGMIQKSSEASTRTRTMMGIGLKMIDFGIQIYLLIDMMENGLPIVLITIFTVVIVLNALTTAVMVASVTERTGLAELLLDTLFDIMVAVGLPMLVLLYCLTTFHFDRQLLAINLEMFPPGWFERGASVNSDPVQPEIIRSSLNSLRIFSVMSVFARVGTNCALCRRFYQLAALIKDPVRRRQRIYLKHRPSAIVFVLIAIAVIVFVEESVRTSAESCQPHPECVQHARRWIMLDKGDLTQCPCLKLIDENPGVKTYDEWVNSPDVEEKVSHLATSGDLQMVSLVNRRLSTFPEQLRRCSNLRHLSLVYADTEELPAWIKEFTRLEYFHIEGKYQLDKLIEIPDNIFEDMSSLTFLHLAAISVSSLPPMKNLKNLKYLALAELLSLQELPSFEGLESVETVILAIVPLVDSIPDVSPLSSLKVFATSDRGTFCCNGFIGECDLTHSMCLRHPLWGTPAAVCLSPDRTTKLPSAATSALFANLWFMICADQAHKPGDLETGPTRETSEQCGGVQYRQCVPPEGGVGMCYSARMMGIACGRNDLPKAMRRRQIAEGIGERCDPAAEAWLGCQA